MKKSEEVRDQIVKAQKTEIKATKKEKIKP
jgi:hypothetical protein